MRRILTGVRGGKSCVIEEIDCNEEFKSGGPYNCTEITVCPPPSRPPANGKHLDLKVPVGVLRWMTVNMPPGGEYVQMHHTDTIDCNTVIAGSMELILDDGRHPLEPGDCVLLNGVDHAWKAGPKGCSMSFMFIGTPPPA